MTINELRSRDDLPALLNTMGLTGFGVEVGVFKGEFSRVILDEWKDGILLGVDSYNEGTEFHLMLEAINNNMVHVLAETYRLIVNTSERAVSLVPSELAFIFLDADHSYPAMRLDLRHWWPKLRKGGCFAGHDLDKTDCGVKDAVMEFSQKHNLEVTVLPEGTWVIIKP